MSCPRLPLEIVSEIANMICFPVKEWDVGAEIGGRRKPHWWASIEGLSLTSRDYRNVALGAWFYTLFVDDPSQIRLGLELFPEIGRTWTRYIS